MTDRENIAAGSVLDIVGTSVRTQQLESAGLVAILQKLLPAVAEEGGDGRREEIVEATTDDVFAPETEQFTRSDAGFLIVAIVIGDKNRRRGVENDGTEEGLKFAGSVFGEPGRQGKLRLRRGRRGRDRIDIGKRLHFYRFQVVLWLMQTVCWAIDSPNRRGSDCGDLRGNCGRRGSQGNERSSGRPQVVRRRRSSAGGRPGIPASAAATAAHHTRSAEAQRKISSAIVMLLHL